MQIEADAEPNFLIIMLNNVQDPNASNPSQSAGKYLTSGEGAIKEAFQKCRQFYKTVGLLKGDAIVWGISF